MHIKYQLNIIETFEETNGAWTWLVSKKSKSDCGAKKEKTLYIILKKTSCCFYM